MLAHMVDRPGIQDSDPLLTRVRAGDWAAFEELYRIHLGRVHALCLRLTADVAQAEELCQDVFVRLWERLDSFRGESAFSTWLYRLTVNLVLDRQRADGRRQSWLVNADDVTPMAGAARGSDPGSALELERAIAALPPGARVVFVLHDVEGYRHHEIAELTGLAEGTCKSQLHRARRLLREVLR
jgi:RNA polymerase sigma-70 factor, ECF subfamily